MIILMTFSIALFTFCLVSTIIIKVREFIKINSKSTKVVSIKKAVKKTA